MDLATVPAAPPTRKNQRTTSWPAPISAIVPYQRGSRLMRSAFWCVSDCCAMSSVMPLPDPVPMLPSSAARSGGGRALPSTLGLY